MCDFGWSRVDWDATGSMLQGWGSILGALAVGYAAVVGHTTFEKWKKQKISERKLAVAERIMTCVYRIEDALNQVRAVDPSEPELKAAENKLRDSGEWPDGISEYDAGILRHAQVILSRSYHHETIRSEVRDILPLSNAIFGEILEKALRNLDRQFTTVSVYATALYKERYTKNTYLIEKIKRSIWSGYTEGNDNEIDREIERDITIIRDICLPYLREEFELGSKRSSFFG